MATERNPAAGYVKRDSTRAARNAGLNVTQAVVTREQVIHQLAKRHAVHAEPVDPDGPEGDFHGVNVWALEEDGALHPQPWSTVWWPTVPANVNEADFVWGPAYQYRAAPSTSDRDLADQIVETMKANLS